jgi:hypothetical protein
MTDDDKRRGALGRLRDPEPWRTVGTVVSDDGLSDPALCCPSCASTSGLHLGGIRTLDAANGNLAERIRDGTFPFAQRPDKVAGLRGAQLEIGLSCEMCGTATLLGLQFHKGMIFVCWKPVVAAGASGDIWRD